MTRTRLLVPLPALLALALALAAGCSGSVDGQPEASARGASALEATAFPDGALLQGSGDDRFVVERGKLRLIPDETTFRDGRLRASAVRAVPDAVLASMPRGASLPTTADYVLNLIDGNQVFPQLLADLRAARKSIVLSSYLLFNDPVGNAIAEVLIARANDPRNPVEVRVLSNVLESRGGDIHGTGDARPLHHDPAFDGNARALSRRLRDSGIKVVDTATFAYGHRARNAPPEYEREAARLARNTGLTSILHTDHRKLVVIDGTVGYCGSANAGSQYMYDEPIDPGTYAVDEAVEHGQVGDPEAWPKWHDGSARFEGPVVRAIAEALHERWVLDGGDDYAVGAPVPTDSVDRPPGVRTESAQFVTSGPSKPQNDIRKLFLYRIRSARRSIFIENPYLYEPSIVAALVEAKRANPALRVDLVMPSMRVSDNANTVDAAQFRYQDYLPVGIGVFEYQTHFNHLKLATFDERYAIFGSANLNYRSMGDSGDFEAVVMVESPATARDINARVRDVDTEYSVKYKLEDVTTPGPLSRELNTRSALTIMMERTRQL